MTRILMRHYFRAEYVGREHVPKDGPALLIGNHPSYLDPWFVGFGTPRWVTWLAWEEAFDWPVLGRIVAGMGSVPLNLERASPSSVKAAYEILARERLLGIFIEGGRSEGLGLGTPRRGPARIALQCQVPVVPVSLAGVRRLWPRDGVPRPGPVRVTYHPPLDPREFAPHAPLRERETLLTGAICAAIRRGLPENGRHRGHAGESRPPLLES